MVAVLLVYLISIPLAWPTPKRTLPRGLVSMADLLTFCHASYLMHDPIMCVQRPVDTQRHLYSKVFLAERLYLFGRYKGTDGQEHAGFDMAYTTNAPSEAHVHHIKPPSWRRRIRDRTQELTQDDGVV